MAKFTFNNYENDKKTQSTHSSMSRVGYFNSLKDDGDEAIVRFAYNTPEEFELTSVHRVKIDDKWRNVSCLREDNDSFDVCPLCKASKENYRVKFFVKLIEYTTNGNGEIVATPKVWERPVSFATTLADNYKEYGNLSNYIFKIKRTGAKGSLQTTYSVLLANQVVYKPELYVADFSAFQNFELAHHSYIEESYSDLVKDIESGRIIITNDDSRARVSNGDLRNNVPQENKTYTPYIQQPTTSSSTQQQVVNQSSSSIQESIVAQPSSAVIQPVTVTSEQSVVSSTSQPQTSQSQVTTDPASARPRRFYNYG